jgi:hypothetical protein
MSANEQSEAVETKLKTWIWITLTKIPVSSPHTKYSFNVSRGVYVKNRCLSFLWDERLIPFRAAKGTHCTGSLQIVHVDYGGLAYNSNWNISWLKFWFRWFWKIFSRLKNFFAINIWANIRWHGGNGERMFGIPHPFKKLKKKIIEYSNNWDGENGSGWKRGNRRFDMYTNDLKWFFHFMIWKLFWRKLNFAVKTNLEIF